MHHVLCSYDIQFLASSIRGNNNPSSKIFCSCAFTFLPNVLCTINFSIRFPIAKTGYRFFQCLGRSKRYSYDRVSK